MYIQTATDRINTDKQDWEGLLTGLVDRDGTFYPCYDHGHHNLALQLGYETLDTLLFDHGWVHVGVAAGVYTYSTKHVTQAQITTLWDIRMLSRNDFLQDELDTFITKHNS